MTLREWCDANNCNPAPWVHDGYNPMMVVNAIRVNSSNGWDLYHLSDYFVSANEAGSVWLAKRPSCTEV